jgi:glutamate dehydrogenase (NAD(P)+)
MIESTTGVTLTPQQRAMIAKGPSELELVNSGLEDTMVRSYHEIREIKNVKNTGSLRTAAFVAAVDKIAVSYMNMGIWP